MRRRQGGPLPAAVRRPSPTGGGARLRSQAPTPALSARLRGRVSSPPQGENWGAPSRPQGSAGQALASLARPLCPCGASPPSSRENWVLPPSPQEWGGSTRQRRGGDWRSSGRDGVLAAPAQAPIPALPRLRGRGRFHPLQRCGEGPRVIGGEASRFARSGPLWPLRGISPSGGELSRTLPTGGGLRGGFVVRQAHYEPGVRRFAASSAGMTVCAPAVGGARKASH